MGSSKRIGSLSIKTGSLGPGMHNSMDLGEIEEFEAVIESEPIMLDSEASDLLLKDSEVAVDIDPEHICMDRVDLGRFCMAPCSTCSWVCQAHDIVCCFTRQ
jgi:hypothetical protein